MKTGTKGGIRSTAKQAIRSTALIGASLLALSAQAGADTLDADDPITVTAERARPQSPKYVAPLLDTPQTITIVTDEVIKQQNLLGLRDILSTLPGITFGAGEGGGGYGDSINLRGYSANNDITVDGVRDSAQYSRTDPFNVEQVELINGANSVYSGAGSIGGSINLVSKRAEGTGRTELNAALGTDAYGRVTVDTDQNVTESIALRLNMMMHQNDVPGRDVERYERWGFAPSIVFGLGTPTRVTVSYMHQEDDNIPQYGVPFAINAHNTGVVAGADEEAYYGWRNLDEQVIEIDQATAVVEHDFSPTLSLRNLTRAQRVTQEAVITNLGGTYCTPAGINPYTGAVCASPGTRTFGVNGTTNFRNSENELLYNQTDLTWKFSTGGAAHTLVTGLSLSREDYTLDNGSPLYNSDGTRPAFPVQDLDDPDNLWTGPVNFIRTGHSEAELESYALYAFDAIELSPNWEINGGLRLERHKSEATLTTYSATTGVATVSPTTQTENDLFSYRAGLIYKPAPNASVYIAYGNSQSPPQTSVIVTSNTSCTSTQTCDADPEEAETIEVGVKWDVFDERLSLTAAVFRNERSAFYVASDVPGEPSRLDGQSRVDGVALGASGLISDNWSIFANYTFLDSELLQDVADTITSTSFRSGDPLPNTPEHSFSVWTTYQLTTLPLMLGYGATYGGEVTFNRFDASSPLYYTDDYWVHRAMAGYDVTKNVALQLNVNNLFDEEYYTRVRNNAGNGWATPGEARAVTLGLVMRY